jgi:uncharacterized membrane protein
LFGLVLLGQAAFVFPGSGAVGAGGTPAPRLRKSYLASVALGIGLFLPWCYFIVARMGLLKDNTSWVAGMTGYPALGSRLFLVSGLPFIDTGVPHGTSFQPTPGGFLVVAAVLPFLVLAGFSLADLWRTAGPRARAFVLAMIAPTALLMILPDLVLGGCGITTARFLFPALLGLEIAVAFAVGRRLAARETGPRVFAGLAVLLLLVGGIVSSWRSASADTWWNKYLNYTQPQVAAAIRTSGHPLILGDNNDHDLFRMIALAWQLPPEASILLVKDVKSLRIPDGYTDVFWYASLPQVRGEMERAGYRFEVALKDRGLWKVISKPDPATR